MKFSAVLVALMAASTALAAPTNRPAVNSLAKAPAKNNQQGNLAAAAKSAKGKGKGSSQADSVAASVAASADPASATAADNSTSVDDSSASNSTDDSSAATSTSTAASATRTRPCDQGDQSLAAGLTAAVVVGMGQQASVLTLQNISSQAAFSASDFSDGVTRLQQFTDTMGLQLQMAQGIADDDSFAQTQLKLLAASQTDQDTQVKGLASVQSAADAQGAADTLSTLLTSFLASTNNAQDGAEQALIDCFLPLTTVSG
ncbi:hypothetical protein GGX14DRAFT_468557 [Mycena pura]|uniref:Cell wall protein n=1 Tax=Mycena pura TaxID=153505 RepID=A0AAD6Y6C9_9AGAR|nr:hypothetical protein GGX14DRAFT_468557 [Mycena pura]